ncbi:MAG: pyridoxine 5'-phosphate synthase [Polyangiaceae bacterium]|nr:pyridoxine 5'-phosphate synthase [Polyangiaceae bacterium]
MIRLNINIDHVATLRNQRDAGYPCPLQAARACLEAGADGITIHLREDRRHIRDQDVTEIAAYLRDLPLDIPFREEKVLNLEIAATEEMLNIARSVGPDVITLVPEKREERTTEGGLDVIGQRGAIEAFATMCRAEEIKLSLFIEASLPQVEASQAIGAQQIEFHTGHYCEASSVEQKHYIEALRLACERAAALGLEVAAGHGLNQHNVAPIAALPHLVELNIGHAVIADSILVGLSQAVLQLRGAIDRGVAPAS